jgi:TatD DNase family protein
MLVDSHCHLNFPDFKEDFEQVLNRAELAGVRVMQTICTKVTEFEVILNIAEKYNNIYCSIGVHPNETGEQQLLTAEEIIEYSSHPKVIGIGETGLDFYYENSPKDLQIKSFRKHIKAARVTGLPIIVHTRDADVETIDILQEEMKQGEFKGLIHCFSTSKELAEKAMELGLYISISGIVTFKKATELQEIVKDLPLERLLVETDAPYLAPTPYRGKRNEPAFTKHTAEFIASLKNIPYSEVEKVTTQNFFSLFSKANLPSDPF